MNFIRVNYEDVLAPDAGHWYELRAGSWFVDIVLDRQSKRWFGTISCRLSALTIANTAKFKTVKAAKAAALELFRTLIKTQMEELEELCKELSRTGVDSDRQKSAKEM